MAKTPAETVTSVKRRRGAPERQDVDWARVEAQFCAGQMTLREIATEHGISHTAIQKRAEAQGWTRDLTAKAKRRRDELVAKSLVASNELVAKEARAQARKMALKEARDELGRKGLVTSRKIAEHVQVEVQAQIQARALLAEREDVARARRLTMRLFGELETVTAEPELVEALRDIVEGDDDGKDGAKRAAAAQEAWQRLMALPSRIKAAKDLSESLSKLVDLERRILRLDDYDPDDPAKSGGVGWTVTVKSYGGAALPPGHKMAIGLANTTQEGANAGA